MKNQLNVLIIIFISCNCLFANYETKSYEILSDTNSINLKKNTLSVEFLGSGNYFFTFNYERLIFNKNKHSVLTNIGININPFMPYSLAINTPLTLSYQYSLNKIVHTSLGFGFFNEYREYYHPMYTSITNSPYFIFHANIKFLILKRMMIKISISNFNALSNNLRLGYDRSILPGLSLGYTF